MEAYVHGVSTRKVDDLVVALGIDAGISKSEVSRICGELDDVVGAFRERRLDHVAFPYLFLDATYVKAHAGASVVSKAIVIATGVTAKGDREVLGLAVGDSEDGAFTDGLPALAAIAGPVGRPARRLRCPRGPQRSHRLGAARRRLAALIGPHSASGPSGPDSPRRGAPWQRRPIEVPRQTSAPAGWRGPHRPEGDVPESTER